MSQSESAVEPPETESGSAPPKKRRMTPRRWIVLAVVVALAGIGGGVWWFLQPKSPASATARSFTATAEKGTQTQTVGVSGTLSPSTQADLSFSVAGTVTKVYVKVGDTVTKGEKLARVDNSDLQDALDLAEADLDTAEANLEDLEDADASSAAITAAEAQIDSAKAAVDSAEDDLDNAVLRSTISGTVASLDIEVGDTVSSSSGSSSSSTSSGTVGGTTTTATTASSQVTVIATSKWKLEATVGSADLDSLEAGQAVEVTPDGATEPIKAEVTSVGIVATSTSDGSATFPVVVTLSGKHPDLYSGTTADAVVTVGEYSDVLTIPTAAITTQDGKSVVTKVDGDTTAVTEVTIGRVFGDATEVTAGLSEGDEVQITLAGPSTTAEESGESSDSGGLFGGSGGGFGGGDAGGGGAPPAGGAGPGGGQ